MSCGLGIACVSCRSTHGRPYGRCAVQRRRVCGTDAEVLDKSQSMKLTGQAPISLHGESTSRWGLNRCETHARMLAAQTLERVLRSAWKTCLPGGCICARQRLAG